MLPPDAQDRAIDAYQQRYRRYGEETERYSLEKERGMKRVDILMEYKHWCGLKLAEAEADVWELAFMAHDDL